MLHKNRLFTPGPTPLCLRRKRPWLRSPLTTAPPIFEAVSAGDGRHEGVYWHQERCTGAGIFWYRGDGGFRLQFDVARAIRFWC